MSSRFINGISTTELDAIILDACPDLELWERWALASEWRELNHHSMGYSLADYLAETDYGTFRERAHNSIVAYHEDCGAFCRVCDELGKV